MNNHQVVDDPALGIGQHRVADPAGLQPGEIGNDQPIPPMSRYHNADLAPRAYDPDKAKSLLQAMFESEEYTEYVLDRRFACCQLGMNLPIRVTARKVAEKSLSPRTGPEGITEFDAVLRIDTPGEADYFRNGGILQYVLRSLLES